MHVAGRRGAATLEALLSCWGGRRPGRACTTSSSITSGACRALLCTRTVSCLVCMRTNSLALNGSGPADAVCRRKPSPMIAYHKLGAHELGAWRRAVVRRLDLGAGVRPPRLVAGSYLQQHQESLGPSEGGGDGRLPPGHSGRLQASH